MNAKRKPSIARLLVCLTICLPAWCPASTETDAQEWFHGKVLSVADGDTLTVLRDLVPLRIRLHGIDCPESSQPFGKEAAAFTAAHTLEKEVSVKSLGMDRYGRVIGIVITENGDVLNHQLVRNGLAWWYRQYAPEDRVLRELEAQARARKTGLWADATAEPPWDFRKRNPSLKETPPAVQAPEIQEEDLTLVDPPGRGAESLWKEDINVKRLQTDVILPGLMKPTFAVRPAPRPARPALQQDANRLLLSGSVFFYPWNYYRLGTTSYLPYGSGYSTGRYGFSQTAGRSSYMVISGSRGYSSSFYTNTSRSLRIRSNINSGSFFLLDDQSLWRADPREKFRAMFWRQSASVNVSRSSSRLFGYNYLLLNTDNGQSIHVEHIGR